MPSYTTLFYSPQFTTLTRDGQSSTSMRPLNAANQVLSFPILKNGSYSM